MPERDRVEIFGAKPDEAEFWEVKPISPGEYKLVFHVFIWGESDKPISSTRDSEKIKVTLTSE